MAAVLTLGASLAVLIPLARPSRSHAPEAHDLEVYRDQLAELERDAVRGLIAPAEAAQARAEIGRRLLRSATPQATTPYRSPGLFARAVGAGAVLAVPVLAWGLYSAIGSPELPSQPLEQRLAQNPEDQTFEELLARAEAHLAGNPEDGRGWDLVAPIYLRMGRLDDAALAYRNAIRLLGSSADRQANLGEALINADSGNVGSQARQALENALAVDKTHPKARYYLAMALAQRGDLEAAASAWQAMLAELPAEAPWRPAVESALGSVEAQQAAAATDPGQGPSPEEVEAAAAMSSEDRTAMVETMVATLDGRLRQNPQDLDGWMRLVRSYIVLGRPVEARGALARGLSTFGENAEATERLNAFAAANGLGAAEMSR